MEKREAAKKAALDIRIDEPHDGDVSDPDEMIAEISFGKPDMQDIEYLKIMGNSYEDYMRNRGRYAFAAKIKDEEERKKQ